MRKLIIALTTIGASAFFAAALVFSPMS